ncbi:hypothetical protein [Undibacterium sp. TS12]|uniref:hypothetical protein n=1 Tax=Undibacterium sp. TS12 TaxID=2908202 RepID=UPI001F4C6037|nr:hypothetical protein [Undibacterium sp. TS12]MCH8621279.1 hypothetical protein [Undibacterium sp. TS12]
MSYTLFLKTLESKRDEDGHSGCYRDDAVRALAQDDLASMLAKQQSTTGKAKNCIEELNQMLTSGARPDFSNTDLALSTQTFDAKYTHAVERCNLFLIQKQLTSLNTQAVRVDIAARHAGIDLQDSSATLTHPTLLKELDVFKKLSTNVVGLLAFDISRQEASDSLQKSIQQIGDKTRTLLASLSNHNHDLAADLQDTARGTSGIRNGN